MQRRGWRPCSEMHRLTAEGPTTTWPTWPRSCPLPATRCHGGRGGRSGPAGRGRGWACEVPIDPAHLRAVLDGRHPTSGHRLRSDRATVLGFDLTFSAPKSVSVVFALGGEEVARQVRRRAPRGRAGRAALRRGPRALGAAGLGRAARDRADHGPGGGVVHPRGQPQSRPASAHPRRDGQHGARRRRPLERLRPSGAVGASRRRLGRLRGASARSSSLRVSGSRWVEAPASAGRGGGVSPLAARRVLVARRPTSDGTWPSTGLALGPGRPGGVGGDAAGEARRPRLRRLSSQWERRARSVGSRRAEMAASSRRRSGATARQRRRRAPFRRRAVAGARRRGTSAGRGRRLRHRGARRRGRARAWSSSTDLWTPARPIGPR